MLQLQHIHKSYTTGDFTQVALDDISVSFRDNEFVAILGPSGSGKTTLLNIVGGLDHYDSGDLVIDGISTKEYKDRDWDAFRNNRVGFVFQSYNLIPHQTILANVELALTLSGVSRDERHERARKALEEVGLAEHVNKKPNQLSGGQMQRVAIARALINDPEILLADEPTGALDSKTSIQIMDLLTKIAKDRLVVMVTHNPELANEYATRIVNLSDGHITSDTDPYEPTPEEMRTSSKPVRHTHMSLLTALGLSFNNLMTKKGRTIMTALAGSIGIIGIAAILSLANGVNNYIASVEEETLSEYPLEIQSTSLDMTSMLASSAEMASAGENGQENDGKVQVAEMLTGMLGSIGKNDLASLKEYLDSGKSGIEQYTNSIEYSYDIRPQIYRETKDGDGYRQVNPDQSFSSLGIDSTASSNSLMSMSMSSDMFYEMPRDTALYEGSYDVKAGRWPQKYNECVLVLTTDGYISDFLQYTLGLRDADELDEMVEQFAEEEEVTVPEDVGPYDYDDILGITFKLVNACDYYEFDSGHDVWVDKTDNDSYMERLVKDGEDIKIVGIVQPAEDANATMLTSGICYPASLTDHIIENASKSKIVKEQLAHPKINVFTGKEFGEEDEDSGLGMDSLFTIDTGALSQVFSFDASKMKLDMSAISKEMSAGDLPEMPSMDTSGLDITGSPSINQEAMADAAAQLTQDYMGKAAELAEEHGIDASTAEGQEELLRLYMELPSTQELMAKLMPDVIDTTAMQTELSAKVQAYMAKMMSAYLKQLTAAMQAQMQSVMQQAMTQLSSNMASAMSIDEDAFANAFQFDMDEETLTELMMSMMGSAKASYSGNLSSLGYADMDEPSGIAIYPKDFESKEHVVQILDDYNAQMEADGEEDKAITYTDIVGALMSSVTTIVDMISYVLIAFVSISLVVSSIMIGIITYISVLERRKEIGILRAIGASKRDISHVFNAETIIEGLVAGLLGVGITALLCIPASALVYSMFDVPNIAQLPASAAVVLVIISVVLTFVAGLIPASSASRKDPVEALRSE